MGPKDCPSSHQECSSGFVIDVIDAGSIVRIRICSGFDDHAPTEGGRTGRNLKRLSVEFGGIRGLDRQRASYERVSIGNDSSLSHKGR